MTPTLREAQAPDFAALVAWLPDARMTLRWAGPGVRFPFTAAELQRELWMDEARSFVRAADDQVLAFGQFWPTLPGTVHLGRIIAAPGVWRQGHGRALSLALINTAAADFGARAVTVRIQRDDFPSRNLYSRLGFQEVPAESDSRHLFMRHMIRRAAAAGGADQAVADANQGKVLPAAR